MGEKMKLFKMTLLAVMASIMVCTVGAAEENTEVQERSTELNADESEFFSDWLADAPALGTLIEYVEAVTDTSSADYIPPEDRIAVFDMDGTLCAEDNPVSLMTYLLAYRILKDPSCNPDPEMLEFGRALRDHTLTDDLPDEYREQMMVYNTKAFEGMTLQEYADLVTEVIVREADGFEGMTYAETFFLPMIEVVEYLQSNDFECFVCSGSDRFFCRVLIEGMLDIPYKNIIGTDVELIILSKKQDEDTDEEDASNEEAESETVEAAAAVTAADAETDEDTDAAADAETDEDTDAADAAEADAETDGFPVMANYTDGDCLVRTDRELVANIAANKVLQIARDIGKQPVLCFGNSFVDVSMLNYTIYDNPYRSAAFMIIADDEVREYGDAEEAEELRLEWEEMGYYVISMRDDWETIFGEDVVKTGSFRWVGELAEDLVPVDDTVTPR